MQAVILAAGRGRRMNGFANDLPKCLIPIGGRTLLEHQVQAMREAGVDEVCIVTGYGAKQVRARLGDTCSYVQNDLWATTNSIYSLGLARDWIRGDFLLANADVLAKPEVYRLVVSAPESVIAYDSTSGLDDEHMKVCIRSGRVVRISKNLEGALVHGESLGVLKLDAHDAAAVLSIAAEIADAGGHNSWVPAAIDRMVQSTPIRALDIAPQPWIEIDFPDDVSAAESKIWPSIQRIGA